MRAANAGQVAALIVMSLLLIRPAAAEDIVVYESLSEIRIGRVFLSHRERSTLDDGGGTETVVQQVPQKPRVTTPVRKKKKRKPAGYIVSSTGELRVWSESGFVAREPASTMRFPGDVAVKRAETGARETEQSDVERNSESPDEGA